MPKTDTVDKFFNAVNEGVRRHVGRGEVCQRPRLSRLATAIDEAERGQREAIDLTRRVAASPRDVSGFYSATVRSVTDAQGRVLDLTRQLLDELSDSQREGREACGASLMPTARPARPLSRPPRRQAAPAPQCKEYVLAPRTEGLRRRALARPPARPPTPVPKASSATRSGHRDAPIRLPSLRRPHASEIAKV